MIRKDTRFYYLKELAEELGFILNKGYDNEHYKLFNRANVKGGKWLIFKTLGEVEEFLEKYSNK